MDRMERESPAGSANPLPGSIQSKTTRNSSTLPVLFLWRRAVLSPLGPESATTRYVLLALSTFMDVDGCNAFPSESRLAEASGLSRRAIIMHMKIAEQDGWIGRRKVRRKGRIWHGYVYEPRFPVRLDGLSRFDEVNNVHLGQGQAVRAAVDKLLDGKVGEVHHRFEEVHAVHE